MRKLAVGVATLVLATLAFSSPASASVQKFHSHFNGLFAEALWETQTSTSFTDTYINVTAKELFLDQFTGNFDSNGDFTGATDTSADVTSGYSFSITNKTFDSASVSGTAIPAQTCTFDANFELIGCSDTTIDASAAWTGQGDIIKTGENNDHFHSPGFTENDHFSATFRDATATGTIGGQALTTTDLVFADLGRANSGTVVICHGSSC